ncbi:retropepsin-like aspartic protease [Moheibacter sediminis]|uniref:Aspartyl protease n=1 Tax=Moheibacter sediminis TaxID=1434700 RepID=A0A1W2CNH6_9FLAO|nr:aspartyl protease family protein [Moheibacter sediminis]SMC86168.1 Aspartyl protease [Moheibacter sediminis]
MKAFRLTIFYILTLLPFILIGQEFSIEGNKNKFSLPFQHVGNLVIIPLSINGSVPLNFIIDTGSPHTIITNLEAINYFKLNKGKPIQIAGLGNDSKTLEAYLSMNNTLKIGLANSYTTEIVLLFEKEFNLSSRFGVPIYGIIGYDLLNEFVTEINYSNKKITFYKHDYFYKKKADKIKKFDEVNLEIKKKKPYVTTHSAINGVEISLKLLIDSGSWDAVWLFEDGSQMVNIPSKYIVDYLGFGLNGEIHGKKSRINYVQLGSVKLEEPTTSFPDTLSTRKISRLERNGTIGGEILKRFTTIYDYKNQKLFVKKNKKFNDKFNYNMAGMELYQPYPELPYLEVMYIRENSPAALAGIKKGDAIQFINGKKVGVFQNHIIDYRFAASKLDKVELDGKKHETISLPEMLDLFKQNEGEKITIIYTRGNNGIQHETSFILEKSI